MEKLFVPYKESMELKSLGFDEPCIGYFNRYKKYNNYTFWVNVDYNTNNLKIPLYQQAFKWFRDKYGIVFNVLESGPYYANMSFKFINGDSDIDLGEFDIYEEAELAFLRKTIEIIKGNAIFKNM